ncbi:response regulator [Leptolyngbya sp. PCC 6406]|uniref:response regulator n=1 Tax=Leptolyngbya sp. PCC 6406 TaxID=1173264 RepID=UPI0002ACC96D|nr:response regulator [Leptolyngbya sp. PCC 6406]
MASAPYILLVDDEPQNLFLMGELLELEGYTVQTAESGAEALEIAEAQTPALILLDVMMPDMDGFEVCDYLRANPTLSTVPIIFLTALDDDESKLRGVEALGDDYLTKPIKTKLVLKKIQTVLRLHQMRQENSQRTLATQAQLFQQTRDRYEQQMTAVQKISETLSEKFHLFVPQQFLSRIAPRGVESIQVGNATESEMTVLFCDIRDFTQIVEFQEARETFEWLNALFEQINQAITQNAGFVDKYLGDSVMAVFDRAETHITDGLQAAIAICQQLAVFNETRDRFHLAEPLRMGIGLHTGRGVIGTVGANQRMDTTVVGDVVNTASRLEEMTKTYQCQVIASEEMVQGLPEGHNFRLRWLDEVAPRGKQTKLRIYEVLG